MRRTRNCLWFERDSWPNTARYFSFNFPTLSPANAFIWYRTVPLWYLSVPLIRSLYPLSALWAYALKPTPACSRTPPWTLFGAPNARASRDFSRFEVLGKSVGGKVGGELSQYKHGELTQDNTGKSREGRNPLPFIDGKN